MAGDEKLFYTIGETAQIVGVKPYVLRYWETEFKRLNPQKSETGQRTYRIHDLQVALTIKRLLYEEQYTIAGAVKKLEELEKTGLAPLDADSLKSSPFEEEEGSEEIPLVLVPAPVGSQAPFPREKVSEIKALLLASHGILRKYGL